MTSAINPNNIDGAYPVAGQDNNSQGFRDNFTNTKTNFQYASDEITDLQNKVILKSALTGTTLNNNMGGSILSNATLQNMNAAALAFGPRTGTVTLDYSAASYQTLTTSGNVTIAFTGWPQTGFATLAAEIEISDPAHLLTFPAAVSVNTLGIQGLNLANNVVTFAAAGTYTFEFSTSNSGTTITVNETNNALMPFNHSGEVVEDGETISLAVTAGKIYTGAGPQTSTLVDGVEGQTKVFTMHEENGDMVMTVESAGWNSGASGTITFNTVGQSCIVRYSVGSWFCIGNNGCTFA